SPTTPAATKSQLMMVTEGGRFFITCMDCHSWGSSQRLPDLPMVSERIDDSPYAPSKGLVIHRPDDSGSCGNDALESHVRIVLDHDPQSHPDAWSSRAHSTAPQAREPDARVSIGRHRDT